jgi:hypothetical protein
MLFRERIRPPPSHYHCHLRSHHASHDSHTSSRDNRGFQPRHIVSSQNYYFRSLPPIAACKGRSFDASPAFIGLVLSFSPSCHGSSRPSHRITTFAETSFTSSLNRHVICLQAEATGVTISNSATVTLSHASFTALLNTVNTSFHYIIIEELSGSLITGTIIIIPTATCYVIISSEGRYGILIRRSVASHIPSYHSATRPPGRSASRHATSVTTGC